MNHPAASTPPAEPDRDATPAGLNAVHTLRWRRRLMLTLCGLSYGAILYAVGLFLGDGGVGGGYFEGWTPIDMGLMLCIALSAPWTVLGFWNAAIGLALTLRGRAAPEWTVPLTRPLDRDAPPAGRTAVIMTIRNEDPERAFARLLAVRASLDATGFGEQFDLFVLSDTNDAAVAQSEEALFAQLEPRLAGAGQARYRRRVDNQGFKAGNVREFLERWGDAYDFFAPLDADSVVSGETLAACVQVMERAPKLGILQTLAVGAPNASGFGRLFQFGMRHGMRSFTAGSAWWQGDCGPFWGHNAVIRTAPFKAHCELPVLPGRPPLGGHIMSHDQVEAVMMRRAGYEVRVAPLELESWEENPPTLVDFLQRDERWCNGNMQYGPLLAMRGIEPVSRLQLWQAMLMYVASPAWMLMILLAALKPFEPQIEDFNLALGLSLFGGMFFLSVSPKIAGALSVAFTPGGVARYGGTGRFACSFLAETLFSMLIAPVVAFRLTVFQIGLLLGRKIQWSGQNRDAYGLTWRGAAGALWGATAYGAALTALLAIGAPQGLTYAAPVLAGLLLAIPFAVLTASPGFAQALRRAGLGAIPEDLTPHPMLSAVDRHAAALDSDTAPSPLAAALEDGRAKPGPAASAA